MEAHHPLDGRDAWECHEQHLAERNKLIEGKRTSEDNFVKTVIQLSSGISLLIPGFLLSQAEFQQRPSALLLSGLAFIFVSLIGGLSEQFLSSIAYGRQIKKTDEYYSKRISDVSPPALSRAVGAALFISFLSFLGGVLLLCISLLVGPWK